MLRTFVRFVMPFYAVARGRTPGIYGTWPECEAQVKGFTAARYKKFTTKSEAENFIAEIRAGGTGFSGGNSSGAKRKSEATVAGTSKKAKLESIVKLENFGKYSFPVDAEGFVHVYTDGSCEGNGKTGACAGLGVYWIDGHALNTAKPVKGRATNNCGEIQAATLAIQIAKENFIKKLQINTDSNYLIKSVTEWMPKWKAKNWKSTTGQELKNLIDFQELDKELTKDITIRWNHVRGHQGIDGNEKADKLAREGSEMYRKLIKQK